MARRIAVALAASIALRLLQPWCANHNANLVRQRDRKNIEEILRPLGV